jgi:hypothetical protein
MSIKGKDAIESEYTWVVIADDVMAAPHFILKFENITAFPALIRWLLVSGKTAFPTFQPISHILTP